MICLCFMLLINKSDLELEKNKYIHLKELLEECSSECDVNLMIEISLEILKGPLVNESYGKHINNFVALIKDELVLIKGLSKEKKAILFKSLAEINSHKKKLEKYGIDMYEELKIANEIEKLKGVGLPLSGLIFKAETFKLMMDILSDKRSGGLNDINLASAKYEQIFGKDNPELYIFCYHYLVFYEGKKSQSDLMSSCNRLKNLIPKGYPNEFDLIFPSDIIYLKYLICLKKSINEAYIFYKKTKNENIKVFKPTSINSRILYYQLCVKMFFELKSDYNMIEMQEEKIRALIFLYKNKDNDLVKIDATILRDMLANKNEIKWFRKVENEFNLTPLPKQSGE